MKRFYMKMSGVDLEVAARVIPMYDNSREIIGHVSTVLNIEKENSSIPVWNNKHFSEGNASSTFLAACLDAEKVLKEDKNLVFTEGKYYRNINADIYVLRSLRDDEK